jgi:hypothetical protein
LNQRKWLGLALSSAIILSGQDAPKEQSKLLGQAAAGGLKLVAVEGEGAKNNIRSRSGIAPVIEVRDEADKPVPGAEVVFQLPSTGPSGVFHGWLKTQTVRSDANGRAVSTGYEPNDEEGRFNIKATAYAGPKSGSIVIAQSNVRGTGNGSTVKSSKRTWYVIAGVAAAGAVAGGIAASRGNGSSTAAASVPITITASPITVAGPR